MKLSLKQKKLAVWVLVGIAAIILIGVFARGRKSSSQFIEAKRGDIVESVSVTGKTKPVSEVTLAFEKNGRINAVYVAVGDHVYPGDRLASLNNALDYFSYEQAQALVRKAETDLESVKKGLRPEELALSKAKVDNASSALKASEDSLHDAFSDLFIKADDAIHNKVDQLFTNPRTLNPKLSFTSQNSDASRLVEDGRVAIERTLTDWALTLASQNQESDLLIEKNSAYGEKVKEFLDTLAPLVYGLTPSENLSQTTLDTWKSALSSARISESSALSALSSAQERYRNAVSALSLAEKQYALDTAGASSQTIAGSEALLSEAKAREGLALAELEKNVLHSPIEGVVTKLDAKYGETAGNAPVISIISTHNLEIEANVPEVDIGRINIGNKVNFTLDAFPGDVFLGRVSYIDPGETIVDGVVNFKMRVTTPKDDRFKSGLTSNLVVETGRKKDVITVPSLVLLEKDDGVYVEKKEGNSIQTVKVKTGARSTDGTTEIVEGVSVGDLLVNVALK